MLKSKDFSVFYFLCNFSLSIDFLAISKALNLEMVNYKKILIVDDEESNREGLKT